MPATTLVPQLEHLIIVELVPIGAVEVPTEDPIVEPVIIPDPIAGPMGGPFQKKAFTRVLVR